MGDDRPEMSPHGLDRLARAIAASREVGRLPDRLPASFGRFLDLEPIGEGRFGVVFRAYDPQAERQVALKLPQAGVMPDPELARRFHRDAEAAAQFDHPAIVPILEAGVHDGCPYLVMPYVGGPTLFAWLAAHPGGQPAGAAVDLVVALADAVQHANERGVLHCDLKPANVLLSPRGPAENTLAAFAPRVADFGLARLLRVDPPATATHLAAGTPPYMAPEQALGRRRDLTARCDVHALAAILYEMLAGTPPYGQTFEEQLSGLVDRDRRPAPLPGVPKDLEAVVLKGLEKRPEARYASAAEFAADLRRWREGRPTRARPVGPLSRAWRWGRRRPVLAACAALAFALLSLAGYAVVQQARHASELRRFQEAAERREFYRRLELVRRRTVERPEEWADDNLADIRKLAAMPDAREEMPELRTQAAAALAEPTVRVVRPLAPGKNAYVVAFSPDGSTVALGERYPDEKAVLRVWLARVETGEVERTLTYPADEEWEKLQKPPRSDGARSIVYAPDGRRLFVGTCSGRVVTWDLGEVTPAGRVKQLRTPRQTVNGQDAIVGLVPSPDGLGMYATTAYGVYTGWSMQNGAVFADLFPARLPAAQGTGRTRTWLLAWRKEGVFYWQSIDLLDHGKGECLPGMSLGPFAVSPCGDAVVVTQDHHGIQNWMMNPRTPGVARPLLGAVQPGGVISVAFSPDGRVIAVGSSSPPGVELRDALSREVIARRSHLDGSGRLAFSPDGRLLAVCEKNRTLLYELRPGRTREAATVEPFEVGRFAASADGGTLATMQMTSDSPPLGINLGDPSNSYSVVTAYRRTAAGLVESLRVRCATGKLEARQLAVTPRGDGRVFGVYCYAPERDLVLLGGAKWGRIGYISGPPSAMAFRKNGDLFVGDDEQLWRIGPYVDKKQQYYRFKPEESRAGVKFTALDVFGEGDVAAGRRDGQVHLFDESGTGRGWPIFDAQEVRCLSVADGGEKWLLAGGSAGDLACLRPLDGDIDRPAERPHREAVTGVAWLPDRAFVTASADQTIRLWAGLDEPILSIRESAPVEQAELRGGRLYVRLRGDWGVRVHRLDRLAEELRGLGLDPGFRVEPDGPPHDALDGLQVTTYGDATFDWLLHRRRGPGVPCAWELRPPSRWMTEGLPFWARWEGRLRGPRPGRREFKAETDGSVRLWVGNRLTLGTGDYKADADGTAELPAGPVPFRLDFASKRTDGSCRLLWRPAGVGEFVPVPAEAFSGP